jgi:endothelin-converting enzyme/putative endopeptidase
MTNILLSLTYLLIASQLIAQTNERPLTSLPYTPSLDTKFMDKTADPCANFYQYACGNWNKLNPIPSDQARWDVYSKVSDDNSRLLWGLLDKYSQPAGERTANEQKIGDLFHACMDTTAVDKAGTKPLAASLKQIADLQSIHDVAAYAGIQQRAGVRVLFDFDASPDLDNSSMTMADLGAGGLGLPDRDYYSKTDAKSQEIRRRYVEHVAKMLQLAGESSIDAQGDAAAIMQIETALAAKSLTRVEKRDPYNLKHKLTADQLQQSTPDFDWDDFLAKLGAPAFESLNVEEPKFFDELNQQLRNGKMSAWRAYFRWHLLHSEAAYLSAPFEQESFTFYGKYLQGTPQLPPRWKKCTRIVDRQLGDALGQVFVAQTFSPNTKAEVLSMTKQIEAEMEADIQSLTWMSDATKKEALRKLAAIVNKIGYPDHWRDYSSVTITPGSFAGDVAAASEFETHRELNKIGKAVDRTEWQMSPPTVNAYYDPQTNDINFPAGVLEPPLFDPKLDSAPNYGNTGATIGHELTHGFDDEGRQFDAEGNLKAWWTAADAKAFEERVACVRNQYAQYVVVDNIHINSSLTLGEDVADLGGTLLAYLAWKHATMGQDLKPVEGMTPDQRYFVGMAQWACGDARPEVKRMHAITDPHSPDEFRINGVVADLPQFGAAFGCKVGQPMMRENACRVW